MNLNPKQPSGTEASSSPPSGRRASWLAKLSGRSNPSGKPKEAKKPSLTDDSASITSHTPLVAHNDASQAATTTYPERSVPHDEASEAAMTGPERSSFVDLMDKANGMTPEQLKEFLAKDKKEQEEKFHTVPMQGRWQWKFKDDGRGD